VTPCHSRASSAYRDAHLAGERAWWLHEVVEDSGGGDVLLAGAAITPDCTLTASERPRDLARIVSVPWSEDFAVDGSTLNVAREFQTGAVSIPLAELPQH
jgi:hypothetical protein